MNEVRILKAVHCAFFFFSCKCIKDERCVCTTANVSGNSPERKNKTHNPQLIIIEAFGLGINYKKSSCIRLLQNSPVSFHVVIKNCGCVAFIFYLFIFLQQAKNLMLQNDVWFVVAWAGKRCLPQPLWTYLFINHFNSVLQTRKYVV